MKEAIENADYVINLCGILFENRNQKFHSIHVDIPESIAKLCSQSNVKKFIHVSAIGANKDSKSKYQQSKFLGEEKALNNYFLHHKLLLKTKNWLQTAQSDRD